MKAQVKKFRLRNKSQIIGYANQEEAQCEIKREPEWLLDGSIKYDSIDEFTQVLDADDQEIYECDIVQYELDGTPHNAVVLWNNKYNCFGMFDTENLMFIPFFIVSFNLFYHAPVKIISHLFEQTQ